MRSESRSGLTSAAANLIYTTPSTWRGSPAERPSKSTFVMRAIVVPNFDGVTRIDAMASWRTASPSRPGFLCGSACMTPVWRTRGLASRLARQRRSISCRDHVLRALVQNKLQLQWSPEQIAAWLRTEHPGRRDWHVCHETIYQVCISVEVVD